MSNKQLTQPEHTSFESLKHESEGNEFWYAREFANARKRHSPVGACAEKVGG